MFFTDGFEPDFANSVSSSRIIRTLDTFFANFYAKLWQLYLLSAGM